MRLSLNKVLLVASSAIFLLSCEQDIPLQTFYDYTPSPLEFVVPENFPSPIIPEDNPLTVEGVFLGKKLFNDPILSGDNSQACADCHLRVKGFSDPKQFSKGITGALGNRNASAIINVAWNTTNFWDGRIVTLENQALDPVTDPTEMNSDSWESVIRELKETDDYPELFGKAFGISHFDSTHVAKAIAQFERTLVSGNAKIDQYERQETNLTLSEFRGLQIYRSERGDCFHCHPYPLLTDNEFHNNGLDPEPYSDNGRSIVTGISFDDGKFKTPTLRNIEFSAPYMHDGRFQTLEEVIEHYNFGGHPSNTIDPLMKNVGDGLMLSAQDKIDLLNFLKTFSDTAYSYFQK